MNTIQERKNDTLFVNFEILTEEQKMKVYEYIKTMIIKIIKNLKICSQMEKLI